MGADMDIDERMLLVQANHIVISQQNIIADL